MRLAAKVAVYIPSTCGEQAASEGLVNSMVDKTLTELSRINGGATATPGKGAWLGNSGLVTEDVTIVTSYCDTVGYTQLRALARLRKTIRENMQQEAVSVEINNTLYVR